MDSKFISCPVCDFANIDISKDKCPQCGGDLSSFKALDKIPDSFESKFELPADFAEIPNKVSGIMNEIKNNSKNLEIINRNVLSNNKSETVVNNKFPIFNILLTIILTAMFSVIIFLFIKINSVETNLINNKQISENKQDKLSAETANLKIDILKLDKKNEVKFLEQDIKYQNKLNDEVKLINKEIQTELKKISTENKRDITGLINKLNLIESSHKSEVLSKIESLNSKEELSKLIELIKKHQSQQFNELEYQKEVIKSLEKLKDIKELKKSFRENSEKYNDFLIELLKTRLKK